MTKEKLKRGPEPGHYHAQMVVSPHGAGVKISREVPGNNGALLEYEIIKMGGVALDPEIDIYDNFRLLYDSIIAVLPEDRVYLNVTAKNNMMDAVKSEKVRDQWRDISIENDIRFKTTQAPLRPDDVDILIGYSNKAITEGATLWTDKP